MVLSSMLGTVFFCLVQNSIDHGIKSNMYLSAGVIFSDILLITLSYFNAQLIPKDGTAEMIVRLVGSVFILGMGISNLVKKSQVVYSTYGSNVFYLAGKGFTLNFFNPANFFSWIAVSAFLRNVLHLTESGRFLFYLGSLTGIFFMEVLISYGAVYLKRYLSPEHLHRINLIMGILFIIFGAALIWPALKKVF